MVSFGKADWSEVVCEDERPVQLDERNIIVDGERVVSRVREELLALSNLAIPRVRQSASVTRDNLPLKA